MASTIESLRSFGSDEPSVSSYLLSSESSGSQYNRRPVTPLQSLIRQDWYYTLLSTFEDEWHRICELYDGPWCSLRQGKLEAILRFFCLPRCFFLAMDGRRRYFRPQIGVMYLYLYLGATIVFNLIVALKEFPVKEDVEEDIQKYWIIISMFLAIVCMLYLFLCVYETVIFVPSEGIYIRVFYEVGTNLFGFLTFAYAICVVMDEVLCGETLDSIVAVIKAMFTVFQLFFLHYFYKAKIPDDSFGIEIILAHLLGTNLGLWFWTVCFEQASENPKNCTHNPVDLETFQSFSSPLFVEYLLLAASSLYEIWTYVYVSPQTDQSEHRNESTNNVNNNDNMTSSTRSSRSTRKSRLGLYIGGIFASLFIVLLLMSLESGVSDQDYHFGYSVGMIILYFAQIMACYICQLSLLSHQRNSKRYGPDHEDILLYISMAGIVLWHGFHAFSLIHGSTYDAVIIDLTSDIIAILQQLFQTSILVNLRRHQSSEGCSAEWIRQCVLFLLITNMVLWLQNSFFIKIAITTPGEIYHKIQHDLEAVGYIVHPLSIFYRFHSSICCAMAYANFNNH